MLPAPIARLLARFSSDPDEEPLPHEGGHGTALVLTGGGARGAYQAGVLSGLAKLSPSFQPDILTGVSAGALNAAFLAGRSDLAFGQATRALVDVWKALRTEHVFRLDRPGVMGSLTRFVRQPDDLDPPAEGGLLDTTPLAEFVERHLGPVGEPIHSIDEAIRNGHLGAFAITTTSYTTGQSITWVQRDGDGEEPVESWDRPMRRAIRTRVRPEHVLGSSALPFFFPAVRIADGTPGGGWHGDGGIRLTAPLSPALHLGADRIIAVNTRHPSSRREADTPDIPAYPPPGQILGVLMNAVFLDVLDRDAQTLGRINALLEAIPKERRNGHRPVDLLVIRPSKDLAKLAAEYDPKLPPSMRLFAGGDTKPNWMSMVLFDEDYMQRLIDIGEADVEARADEIREFLGEPVLDTEPGEGIVSSTQ
ncbi:MAG: patatin-like phospholipase family protein [Bacteroidota bacterium]